MNDEITKVEKELAEELLQERAKNFRLEAKVVELEEKVNESTVAADSEVVSDLAQELLDQRAENLRLVAKIADLEDVDDAGKLACLQDEIAQIRASAMAIMNENAKLRVENDKLRDDYKSAGERIAKLEAHLAQSTIATSEAASRFEEQLSQASVVAARDVGTLRAKIADLEGRLDQAENATRCDVADLNQPRSSSDSQGAVQGKGCPSNGGAEVDIFLAKISKWEQQVVQQQSAHTNDASRENKTTDAEALGGTTAGSGTAVASIRVRKVAFQDDLQAEERPTKAMPVPTQESAMSMPMLARSRLEAESASAVVAADRLLAHCILRRAYLSYEHKECRTTASRYIQLLREENQALFDQVSDAMLGVSGGSSSSQPQEIAQIRGVPRQEECAFVHGVVATQSGELEHALRMAEERAKANKRNVQELREQCTALRARVANCCAAEAERQKQAVEVAVAQREALSNQWSVEWERFRHEFAQAQEFAAEESRARQVARRECEHLQKQLGHVDALSLSTMPYAENVARRAEQEAMEFERECQHLREQNHSSENAVLRARSHWGRRIERTTVRAFVSLIFCAWLSAANSSRSARGVRAQVLARTWACGVCIAVCFQHWQQKTSESMKARVTDLAQHAGLRSFGSLRSDAEMSREMQELRAECEAYRLRVTRVEETAEGALQERADAMQGTPKDRGCTASADEKYREDEARAFMELKFECKQLQMNYVQIRKDFRRCEESEQELVHALHRERDHWMAREARSAGNSPRREVAGESPWRDRSVAELGYPNMDGERTNDPALQESSSASKRNQESPAFPSTDVGVASQMHAPRSVLQPRSSSPTKKSARLVACPASPDGVNPARNPVHCIRHDRVDRIGTSSALAARLPHFGQPPRLG